jgi:hypothetical protein
MRQSSTDQWKGEMIQSRADRKERSQANNDQVDSKHSCVNKAERTQSITDQMDRTRACRHGGGDHSPVLIRWRGNSPLLIRWTGRSLVDMVENRQCVLIRQKGDCPV